jgi:hypothetical protein
MSAITVTEISSTNHKLRTTMMGPKGNVGATIKVIKITPTTDYTAGGDHLDLSSFFTNRIWWLMFMNPTVRNATTGYLQVGYIPGTAKTDGRGGYSPTDGHITFTAGGTESATHDDPHAYPVYAVVSGC